MEEDKEKRRLGLFAWFGYELPLEESLSRMKAAGFDSALLWWGEFEGTVALRKQPDLVRKLGLTVENAHAPFDGCNDIWLPGESGQAYADMLVKSVRECAECGVPVLVVHLTDGPHPPQETPLGLDRLGRAAEAAEKQGVTLAFENLRSSTQLIRVMDTFGGEHIGFCYDSGHHHGWCRDIPWLQLYGTRLSALHLHDNNAIRDSHSIPFTGTINWPDLSKELAGSPYTGAISLEIQASPGEEQLMTPDEFLKRAYESAGRIRKLMEKDITI